MIIKNLSFKFNKQSSQFFFHNLIIEFAPNKVHFIQGDNGVGKSTFFNIIQGAIGKDAFLEASIQLDGTIFNAQANAITNCIYSTSTCCAAKL